jgi:hypothetical protein
VTGHRAPLQALSFVAALATVATSARADSLRWALATDGDACDAARFAREVQLACDALGSECAVVNDEPARRAVLRCPGEGPWTIDVYDGAGRLAWTFALDGEDRTRRAAIWIARTAADAPTAPAGDAPPIPAATPAPQEVTPPPAAFMAPPSQHAATGTSLHPWGLLGAARIVSGTGFGPALGGFAEFGWLVGPPNLAIAVDVGAERSLASPNGYSEAAGRAGAGASYGAPWGSLPVGIAVETGVIAGEISAPPGYTPSSLGFVHGFARGCLAMQLGGTREWRPYAAASVLAQAPAVRVTSDAAVVASSPLLSGALDVGVAWLPR